MKQLKEREPYTLGRRFTRRRKIGTTHMVEVINKETGELSRVTRHAWLKGWGTK